MKFAPYITWLKGVSELLCREVRPSALAVELFLLDASCQDAVTDYGDLL